LLAGNPQHEQTEHSFRCDQRRAERGHALASRLQEVHLFLWQHSRYTAERPSLAGSAGVHLRGLYLGNCGRRSLDNKHLVKLWVSRVDLRSCKWYMSDFGTRMRQSLTTQGRRYVACKASGRFLA
jgi:hypothetical protein